MTLVRRRKRIHVTRNMWSGFGDIAVELDALHPKKLQQMAIDSIEAQFDMELFSEQMEIEQAERGQLAHLAGQLAQVASEL